MMVLIREPASHSQLVEQVYHLLETHFSDNLSASSLNELRNFHRHHYPPLISPTVRMAASYSESFRK